MVPLPYLCTLYLLSCDFLHTLSLHNFPEKLAPNIFGKVWVAHLRDKMSVCHPGWP